MDVDFEMERVDEDEIVREELNLSIESTSGEAEISEQSVLARWNLVRLQKWQRTVRRLMRKKSKRPFCGFKTQTYWISTKKTSPRCWVNKPRYWRKSVKRKNKASNKQCCFLKTQYRQIQALLTLHPIMTTTSLFHIICKQSTMEAGKENGSLTATRFPHENVPLFPLPFKNKQFYHT